MKKILFIALAYFLCFMPAYGADNLLAQCNALRTQAKGTKLEVLANKVCDLALSTKTTGTNYDKTPTTKVKKIIGKIPNRSDASINKDQVQAILKSSTIKGNFKARFLILEYSDLQCPFCKRQWDNKVIESLITKYKGNVASSFRHFPLSFHENAFSGALAAQCIALQDDTKYYDFIGGVFGRGLTDESVLYKTAEDLKLDLKRLKDCMLTSTALNLVNKQAEEGINLFGVTGTPGNVILDTVTGKYKPVIGAYPASEFEAILDKIAG